MTIHAVDKNMRIENVVVDYKDRPDGSESKLNTFKDGAKVLMTLFRLYKNYKPLSFFGLLALLLLAGAAGLFLPVLIAYFQTGLVDRMPTLVVSGFMALAAIQSFFSGLILNVIIEKEHQDFEFKLQLMESLRKGRGECITL